MAALDDNFFSDLSQPHNPTECLGGCTFMSVDICGEFQKLNLQA